MSKLLDKLEALKEKRDEIEGEIQDSVANLRCEGDCYDINDLLVDIEQIEYEMDALRSEAKSLWISHHPEDTQPHTLTERL